MAALKFGDALYGKGEASSLSGASVTVSSCVLLAAVRGTHPGRVKNRSTGVPFLQIYTREPDTRILHPL